MSKNIENEYIYYRNCIKCVTEPVCEVTINVWDGNEKEASRVLALCGECFDEMAKKYNLRDVNGNSGENCTLQNKRYEKYLEEK